MMCQETTGLSLPLLAANPDQSARRLKSRATGSEARLRGLDWAIADYLLKNHKPRATVAKPACAG